MEPSNELLRHSEKPFSVLEDIAQRTCDLLKPDLQRDKFEAFALGFEISLVHITCFVFKSVSITGEDSPNDPPSGVLDLALSLIFADVDAVRYSKDLTKAKDFMRRHLDSASRHATALGLTWIDFSSLVRLVRECKTHKQFVSVEWTIGETGKKILIGLFAKG